MMKNKIFSFIIMCTAITGPLYSEVFIDNFDGTTLDPFWTVVDEPNNYAAGGGFENAADHLRFNNVYTTAYAHIRSTEKVNTTDGIRVDAVMRQDHFGASTWGMSVSIYFDAGNWVSLRIASANGQQGLMKDVMLNGVRSSELTTPAVDLRWYWLITGVELTDTQIKFWSSSIDPADNHFGETNIDYWSEVITEFTMARPVNFTGEAIVFIGKGFSGTGAPNPYFQNNQTSEPLPYGSPGFAGIDYARVTYVPFNYLSMDFNEDYNVDFEDFAEFAMAWAQCTEPNNPDCDEYWKPETFGVWEIDPNVNVTKTQTLAGLEQLDSIDVQMASNEYRDAVFLVSNNSQTYEDVNVAVEIQPLGGFDPNIILIEQTLFTKNRGSVDTADGVYPLTGSELIPGGQSRQFRLRFDTRSMSVTPGSYSYNVVISDTLGGRTKTIPGTLEVWDIQLPSYDILPNNTWAVFRSVELGISGAGNLIPQSVAEMKKYGLNQVFLGPYTDTPNAEEVTGDTPSNVQITVWDTAQFDEIVSAVTSAWNSAPGSESLQWILSLSTKIDRPDLQPTLGIQNRTDIQYPGDMFDAVYAEYLSRLKDRFAYHGYDVNDWMIAFADESTVSRLEGYEIPVAELTNSIDSSIRLTCNSSYRPSAGFDSRYLAAFDVFQPNFRSMVNNPSVLTWLKTSGKPIWTYDYKGDMSEAGKNIYNYYRVFAWNLLKYGYSGVGLWTYSSQGGGVNNVWNNETPMSWLAYKHFDDNDVVRSKRYEMYREGSDDYRYVEALRSIAAVKGKTAEAEQLIQDAVNDITANTDDTTLCDYWRLQIAQRILTYQAL